MRRIFTHFILLIGLIGAAYNCHSQSFDYVENSVYVFNFIKYTNWPQKESHIHIGIVGNTPLEAALRELLSKKSTSKSNYTIHNISVSEAKNMDVVIVATDDNDQIRAIDLQTAHLPILLISEKENMGRVGACICFFIDEDNDFRTGYQLSLRNCKARGLIVSEQILNNAQLIR
jgi:hypothetical protein